MAGNRKAPNMYRMPIHFGPRTGPRRGPDGRTFDGVDSPKSTSISVSFITDPEKLERFLPEGFSLAGEPVVTVTASYMTEIKWLAGRGYNTLGVTFPAIFQGEQDTARGPFLTVLWENLTDPIITGREELGFSKIYCELPEPNVLSGEHHATASWMGFRFLDLKAFNLTEQELGGTSNSVSNIDGLLHYKYMPRTGEWGAADIEYACLTPAGNSNAITKYRAVGDGSVAFHQARWEDVPTQYNIINAFYDLDILEYRGSSLTRTIGGKDLSDQRILR